VEKLSFRLLVGGGCHAVLGAEVAGEGVGTGEAAGLTDLLDSEVGLVVQQSDGIVEAQFADVCRQGNTVAALREGGTDALLREAGVVDKRLSAEVGLEEELLVLYQVTQAEEELLVGEFGEIGDG